MTLKKVSLNIRFQDGPYGGGMSFCRNLQNSLKNNGVRVINHLNDDDIDLILHANVTFTSSYSFYAASRYKLEHPKTLIVQRINDSGLQRTNPFLQEMMKKCAAHSDYIIYISSWLKQHMETTHNITKPAYIIHNGADSDIYNQFQKIPWEKTSPLKIITHHWSPSYLKGHEIYSALDDLLSDPAMREKYTFTYIGNHPKNINFKNAHVLAPMDEQAIASELKNHHVYITGALHEAAGMHHIEAALCGLPILYVNSGGVNEYCGKFGLEITKNNLAEKLNQIHQNYAEYAERMAAYPNTSQKMIKEYLDVFHEIMNRESRSRPQRTPDAQTSLVKLILTLQDEFYYPLIYFRERLERLLRRLRRS